LMDQIKAAQEQEVTAIRTAREKLKDEKRLRKIKIEGLEENVDQLEEKIENLVHDLDYVEERVRDRWMSTEEKEKEINQILKHPTLTSSGGKLQQQQQQKGVVKSDNKREKLEKKREQMRAKINTFTLDSDAEDEEVVPEADDGRVKGEDDLDQEMQLLEEEERKLILEEAAISGDQ